MRIALLSHEYPAETGFGGIGTYTWFHARALARLGHEVHVLTGAASRCLLRPDCNGDGVHVWRTELNGESSDLYRRMGDKQLWWSRQRVRNALDMWAAFRRLGRERPFDVVEMPESGGEGFLVNRLTNIPTVLRFHSPARLIMPFYDVLEEDIRWCSWLEESAVSGATTLTSSSGFLASQLERIGVHREAAVIHNGIDLDWFDADDETDVLDRYDIPRDKPMVLFSGRLEPRKGSRLCPAVVAGILERHDCAFVFAGADLFRFVELELMPALQGRSLRGSVHVLGHLGPQDVRTCLKRADVVFLPSIWESCPYACLEAMAARRAIVASDAGGLPELLENHVNALVVPSGDAPGFEAAIDALLGDAALRQKLGNAARRTVETSLRDTDVAKRTLAVYERLAR